MEKILTQEEMDELLVLSMDSFKEGGQLWSIRQQNEWWKNKLKFKPLRVDRLIGTTFNITRELN